jgi:hypothetical protein
MILAAQAAAEQGAVLLVVVRDVAETVRDAAVRVLTLVGTPRGILVVGAVVLLLAFSLARRR